MKCSSKTRKKFAILLDTITHVDFSFHATLFFSLMNALVYVGIYHWVLIEEKIKQHEMKNKKLCGFSYSKSMAKFEAFRQNISSNINLLFLKSVIIRHYNQLSPQFSLVIGHCRLPKMDEHGRPIGTTYTDKVPIFF